MRNLKKMYIRDCVAMPGHFESLLGNLVNLFELDISGCILKRDGVSAIARLKNLGKLSMCYRSHRIYMPVLSLITLADMDGLVELDVSSNELVQNSVPAIACLKSFEKLCMRHCSLKIGCLAPLANLGCLADLDVSKNKLAQRDVSAIARPECREKLTMENCVLMPDGLLLLSAWAVWLS